MKLTRRQLIFGTAGAAALLPFSYAIRVSMGGYEYPRKLKHLSAKEAVILVRLAEAVIPNENPFGITTADVDVVGGLDDFFDASSELERGEFRILFWIVEHAFPAMRGKFGKFTNLSVEERVDVLRVLEKSGRGIPTLLSRAVKTMVCFPYFNSQKMRETLGLAGWCGP